jgi:hypothetical protein
MPGREVDEDQIGALVLPASREKGGNYAPAHSEFNLKTERVMTMGYDLYNKHGDYFRANAESWRSLLNTAKKHGWKPAGTLAPEFNEGGDTSDFDKAKWAGGYFTNDFQRVSDDDARNIAAALRKAFETDKFSHEEWYIRHFVAYCQNGSFVIW